VFTTRRLFTLAGMSALVVAPTAALAAMSRRTARTAETDVRRLLQMMDRDKNGAVSKDEFLQYMSQTFDRLDVNKSGQLERNELRQMTVPNWMEKFQAQHD